MGKRMIANLVTLINHAPQQLGMGLTILAHHKEGRRDVLAFQNIEDRRRPLRVGSIIEGDRDRAGFIARALNHIGGRDVPVIVSL